MDLQWINDRLDALSGKIGVYYKNLATNETFDYHAEESFLAASVIKLPLLAAVLHEVHEGRMRLDDTIRVRPEDKVPSCGALNYMHSGLEVTILDLCHLMIVISDNTATNILIKRLGYEKIRTIFMAFGLKQTKINRLLFDGDAKRKGIENYFTPKEIGVLLENIHREEVIHPEISRMIIRILKQQQMNHKIPHLLPSTIEVAHKTGESTGITHDVGIIYSKRPFILCFASNDTDVPEAEHTMRLIAKYFYDYSTRP